MESEMRRFSVVSLLVIQLACCANAQIQLQVEKDGEGQVRQDQVDGETSEGGETEVAKKSDLDPEALVAQLRSNTFAEREAAQKSLEELGEAARAAIEKGTGDFDLEIQHRCRVVLSKINLGQLEKRIRAFLAGTGDLPGWQEFKEILGEDEAARNVFAEAYREERSLYDALDGDLGEIVRQTRVRMQDIMAGVRLRQRASLGSTVTMALLTIKKELSEPLLKQSDWLRLVSSLLHHASARKEVTNSEKLPVLKKVISTLADQNVDSIDQTLLGLAVRLDLPSRVPLARSMIKNGTGKKTSRHHLQQAIRILVAEKNLEDVPLLKEYFEDDTVVLNHRAENGVRFKLQKRDLALAGVIMIHGKKPEDYDMPIYKNVGDSRMSVMGFPDDKERALSFEKWNADQDSGEEKKGKERGPEAELVDELDSE